MNYCFSQTPNLNNWRIETLTSEKISEASLSNESWIFEIVKDSVLIKQNEFNTKRGDVLPFEETFLKEKIQKTASSRFVKKVHNGFLIGLNNGEFGGGLYFLSENGKDSYEIAPYIRVRQIFEHNSNIYFSTGLAHLGRNYGSISKLTFTDTKWSIGKSLNLEQSPTLVIFDNNLPYVITSEYILKLDGDIDSFTQVLKAPYYWGVLYPSSAIISNKDIFIAMRKGVLKISDFKTTPKYDWFVKNSNR